MRNSPGIQPRNYSIVIRTVLIAVAAMPQSQPAKTQPPTKSQLDFFESKIRPIFSENCYKCHSSATGAPKAGLELDWKGGWEKGGTDGPAIVPGNPDKSLLIQAVRYTDSSLQMPPTAMLTSDQINDLVSWVRMGAPDPRATRLSTNVVSYGGANKKDHWSFKPVSNPKPPAVKDSGWVKNDIDRFVLSKLESEGMTGNEPADK